MKDDISEIILDVINKAKEPLGTNEILDRVKAKDNRVTRIMLLYRLNELRSQQKIEGKHISKSIKGAWIWWRKGIFG